MRGIIHISEPSHSSLSVLPILADHLFDACEDGDLDQVKRILEADPDLLYATDYYFATPLHAAARTGHLPIVKYLTEKGAYVAAEDVYEMTPSFLAYYAGYEEVLYHLLRIDYDGIDWDDQIVIVSKWWRPHLCHPYHRYLLAKTDNVCS